MYLYVQGANERQDFIYLNAPCIKGEGPAHLDYYGGLGRDWQFEAIALALEGKEWQSVLAPRMVRMRPDWPTYDELVSIETLKVYSRELDPLTLIPGKKEQNP